MIFFEALTLSQKKALEDKASLAKRSGLENQTWARAAFEMASPGWLQLLLPEEYTPVVTGKALLWRPPMEEDRWQHWWWALGWTKYTTGQ